MRAWLCGLGLMLCGTGTICGQTDQVATLTVHVTDPAGSPFQGAEVTAVATVTQVRDALQTDRAGAALFRLSPGIYQVTVQARGFMTYEQTNIEVSNGGSQQLPLVLTVGATECEPCMTEAPPPIEMLQATALTALIEPVPLKGKLALHSRRMPRTRN